MEGDEPGEEIRGVIVSMRQNNYKIRTRRKILETFLYVLFVVKSGAGECHSCSLNSSLFSDSAW
jgi:hypothetical protein